MSFVRAMVVSGSEVLVFVFAVGVTLGRDVVETECGERMISFLRGRAKRSLTT